MSATSIDNAEWACLQWMAGSGGAVEINLVEEGREWSAMAAGFVALGLARKGLCQHTRSGNEVMRLFITDAGRAALASDGKAGEDDGPG